MSYQYILVEPRHEQHIALVQLNRPKELNALCLELMQEVRDALKALDNDPEVRAIVLTGNERAFAAGADIKQMAGKNAIDMLLIDQFSTWDTIKKIKKPIIAAVSGFALGGGNELVMHCDMVIASETAPNWSPPTGKRTSAPASIWPAAIVFEVPELGTKSPMKSPVSVVGSQPTTVTSVMLSVPHAIAP